MTAGTYNITIEKGATYLQSFYWTDNAGNAIPLDGYTAKMQIRYLDATGSLAAEFNTTNSTIVLNTASGMITLSMSHQTTSALIPGKAEYDLELYRTSSQTIQRLLKGTVTIVKEVTL